MINNENIDHLSTEYSAISSYFNNIINFRFIVFGFFIASLGLIISGDFNIFKAVILLVLAIFMWILELRNKGLTKLLEDRGKDIEKIWNKKDRTNQLRFFQRMKGTENEGEVTRLFGRPIKNKPLLVYYKKDLIKIIGIPVSKAKIKDKEKLFKYYLISHSFVIEISYSLTIACSLIYIAISLIR